MYYHSSTFELYSNSKKQKYQPKILYPYNTQVSLTTIGSSIASLASIKGFIWWFTILNDGFNSGDYINEPKPNGSCMISSLSCSKCKVEFKDPSYGTGCLSENINENQSSDQTDCLITGVGCADTSFNYECNGGVDTCFYNIKTSSCITRIINTNTDTTVNCNLNINYCTSTE